MTKPVTKRTRSKRRSAGSAPQSRRFNRSNATMDDIATAARVSTATVSRFFNFPQMLKPRTAQRVKRAVESQGFVPNLLASELASNRSRLVAAVVPQVAHSIFNSTIQALADAFAEEGYSVMLALAGVANEHLQRQLQTIIGRRPDGIILTGANVDAESRKLLRSSGIPTIETWDLPQDPIDLVVGLSHDAVGVAIARHVLALGRQRALLVAASGARAQARCRGFVRTMRAAGAPIPVSVTFAGSTSFGQGRSAVAQHLDNGGKPEVVMCSSDVSAHGAINELTNRGLRVPEDAAVIGFGDMDFAAELTPALTTVSVDGGLIGRQAVKFLMQRARQEKIAVPVVDIGFSLVVRQSG
jgi:LacI family gluconate utilization system Gnt-I transcriptional repressor